MRKRRPDNKMTIARRFGRGGKTASAVCVLLCVLCALLPALAPTAALAGDDAENAPLRISEVMASNGSTVILEDGTIPDWIEIENVSDAPVNLTGYALLTESKPTSAFAFPNGVLQPGEFVVVYCDGSGKAYVGGEYRAPFKLSASGEHIALLDKRGRGIDQVETPELARDQVYCRDARGAWQVSDTATPGSPNVVERSEGGSGARNVRVVAGAVEISEAMSKNATFFPDEDGEYHDYIEIHNISGAPVNLDGWALSDDASRLKRWVFPAITLPADGYLAVHCSGLDRSDDPNHLHTNFKLSSDGEDIYLTAPNGVTTSAVRLPLMEADQAYTLLETGWSKSFAPTPGQPNTQAGADAAARSISGANAVGVYITEVLASSDRSDDWIEIYNSSSQAVDLSGYGLSDNAARPRKWQFPSGTVIQPGAYMGVLANGKDGDSGTYLQTSYNLSAAGGYSVALSDPSGAVLDRLFVPMQYQNISFGRTADLNSVRYFTTPTPGEANSGDAYYGRAPLPVYSTRGGLYKTGDVLTVELSVPSGCRVYYTLDNTDPDESGTAYTGPITITETTVLRTKVYGEGYLESFMDAQSYLFDVNNGDGTLYVVSVVSDPYNLSSEEAGIMVKGPNAWPEYPYGSMNSGANFWMDWEREAHVELFNPDGSLMISQECGIKLHGQYSRAENQQAFKIIARARYGSNRFQGAIFSKRDYTEYQSFLLRSSSQDGKKTRMRDSVLCALAEGTSVMYQETELCVVYLDGKYWGQYNIRERINTASICQFEGWEGDEDDIDLVKANTNTMQGSNETMVQLLTWVKANNTNTPEALEVIGSAIDLQNYIEYMAIEMFTGNTDTLNVKRYRNPKTDGKWRWVLFDLDWAFSEDTNSVRRWLTPGGMGNGNRTDNTLFIACMKNDTFRDRFLTYLGEQMATTFTTQSLLDRFEARYNALKPVLADQFERWNRTEADYAKAMNDLIKYARTRPYRMLQFIKYCEQLGLSKAQMEHYFGAAMEIVGVSYEDIGAI